MNILEKSLFSTNSIKIAPADSPFWYTSGTIGPYFINTHFLYGSEKDANELLEFINQNKDDYTGFLPELTGRVIDFYKKNDLFKNVMDMFYSRLKDDPLFRKCEYVSGGERRDWFFSPVIAHLSGRKHLFIFKNLVVYDDSGVIRDLNGSSVCHICDLVTQASSHKRAWIPAVRNIKGRIIINASIVDRDEGAGSFFKSEKIRDISMVKINKSFVKSLLANKIIDKQQAAQIMTFKKDPDKYGRDFIIQNPGFLKKSAENNSTKPKAQRCIDENPYKLDFKKLGL